MATKLHETNERGKVNFRFIRDGIAGNYDVIYEMIRVIRRAVENDKGLERYAKDILLRKHLNSYSGAESICAAILDSIRPEYDTNGNFLSGIAYVQDIAGRIETIKTPRQTLSDGFGDCDDQTILIASLLGCLGFEDVRIAMTRYAANEPSFVHVYCVAYKDGKRYAMDSSLPDARVNKEVKPYEIKETGIFDDIEGLDGISGFANNTRYHARKFARAAIESLPNIAEVVPLGFVVGNALATGGDLLNRSQGGAEQLSYAAAASKINRELDAIIRRLLNSQIALDTAQARAKKLIIELTTIQNAPNSRTAKVIHASLKTKLDFIDNFQTYADANGIAVVHLDSRAMMIAGVAILGGGTYYAYKRLFGSK